MYHVPVIDVNQKPLMPTTKTRALRWVKSRKATPFWNKGIWCVRLNVEPSARNYQDVIVGVDPGSKREGFTVLTKKSTFLNIQADARTGIKEKIKNRRELRNSRRNRKTPCRQNRQNRSCLTGNKSGKRISPSTKARWDWKLRLLKWLRKLFPISKVVVEDVSAKTKKGKDQKFWNGSFSPLEVGKKWFYEKVRKLAGLVTKKGFETKALREVYGLIKIKEKMSDNFYAHCVDSWVLAASEARSLKPTQINIFRIVPFDFRRRSLHYQLCNKGGKRGEHGGTRSMGHRRGSFMKVKKYGLVFLGGSSKNRISVHSISGGKRLAQNVKIENCKVLAYASWRFYDPRCQVNGQT